MSENDVDLEIDYWVGQRERAFGLEYASAQVDNVVETCITFGTNKQFVPIFTEHIKDMHLIISDGDTQTFNKLEVRMLSKGGKKEWARCLVLREHDLTTRVRLLGEILDLPIETETIINCEDEEEAIILPFIRKVLDRSYDNEDDNDDDDGNENVGVNLQRSDTTNSTEVVKPHKDVENEELFKKKQIKARNNTKMLLLASMDWAFYEQAVVMLSNSYYMHNHFGRYVPDFNGQSPFYRTEFAISANYFKNQKNHKNMSIEEDLLNMVGGFGLMLLHESLIEHQVVRNATEADWTITALRKINKDLKGRDLYRANDIAKRFKALKPRRGVLSSFEGLYVNFIDPETADDEQ